MAEEKFEAGLEQEETIEVKDVLCQAEPEKWMKRPPKVMCGDMREAFKCGREADNFKCNCWNRKCPFFGDCRKCIAFHLSLKQIPTCQRDMVTEIYLNGVLAKNLYIEDELENKE